MASLNARKMAQLRILINDVKRLVPGWEASILANEKDEAIGVLIGEKEVFEEMMEPVEDAS